MDENKSIVTASAAAAMLPGESAAELSGDLGKIEGMVSRAASVYSGDEMTEENSIISQFEDVMGSAGCALREDQPCESCGGIISQSKRQSGIYTSVPRVV